MSEHIELGPDLSALLARLERLGPGRVIVGIVGPPGVGKSTLATQLVAQLGSDRAVVVPMDGFHIHSRALPHPDQLGRRGAIDTFDAGGYVSLLERLRRRSEDIVYAPGFERDIEEPLAGLIPVPRSVPIVITEGNYLLSPEPPWNAIRALLDEVWYLEAGPLERRGRLIARHRQFGASPEEAITKADGSDERNAEQIEQTRSAADLVIRLA